MKKLATLVLFTFGLVSFVTPSQAQTRIGQSLFPLIITAPGSFVVTQGLVGVSGGPTAGIGIVVAADDVTIDLNGYSMVGGAGTSYGIFVYQAHQNLVVKNGTIRNWGNDGIQAASDRNATISAVHIGSNGGSGVRVGLAGVVENCVVVSNSAAGIVVRDGGTVRQCTSAGNGGNGVEGSNGCAIVDCVVFNNRGNGIRAGSGSRIFDNLCMTNGTPLAGTRSGILVDGAGTLVKNNHVSGSDRGYEIDGLNNIFVENTAANNSDDILETAGNIGGAEVIVESNLQSAANALINIAQ